MTLSRVTTIETISIYMLILATFSLMLAISQLGFSTSISKLERYRSCPFSYYLQYGLKIKPQEELKIQIETTRLEIEKTNLELNKQNAKEDRKYRYISLALTVGIPAVTTLISLLVYRKLAYNNLKLIYVDEGRPTTNFNDAVKSIKNLTK